MESKVFSTLLEVKFFCLWAFALSYATSVVLPDIISWLTHISAFTAVLTEGIGKMLTFPVRKESEMIFACFCGRSTPFS